MHDAQIRVAIAGAGGRMGRQLIQATLGMEGVQLGAALERLLKKNGLNILSKLTGLFLAALASQLIFTGIRNIMFGGVQ